MASIIIGFINLTSLSDCKVIINDSDYEVVTIVAIASIIIGFITFTSLNDCKAIINGSDYETAVKIMKLKVV